MQDLIDMPADFAGRKGSGALALFARTFSILETEIGTSHAKDADKLNPM
jgi:hypothetical protein